MKKTIHQSVILEKFDQLSDKEKIETLEKAYSIMNNKSFYPGRDHLVCESMGFKLWNCQDNMWFDPKDQQKIKNHKCITLKN